MKIYKRIVTLTEETFFIFTKDGWELLFLGLINELTSEMREEIFNDILGEEDISSLVMFKQTEDTCFYRSLEGIST